MKGKKAFNLSERKVRTAMGLLAKNDPVHTSKSGTLLCALHHKVLYHFFPIKKDLLKADLD
jgi:hypothetical protein